jgi:hypothetical protein
MAVAARHSGWLRGLIDVAFGPVFVSPVGLPWTGAGGAVDRARHDARVNYVGESPGFLETRAAAAFWR